MGEKFVGKWENVESVGMEGFLKAIGQEEMIKVKI
jgi:hypothetical protein